MRQIIKAIATSLIFAAPTMASAAQPVDCTQAVQNASNLAANIASDELNYWNHRQNFVYYKYGKWRQIVNASTLADKEKSFAAQIRGTTPNRLASFQAAIAIVQAQNCLSAAALRAMLETTTTRARKINFDQFPVTETEATGLGSKKMP
jgi:hypothetical protein